MWLDLPLAVSRYVMYFRFSVRSHICRQWPGVDDVNREYAKSNLPGAAPRMSDVCDCYVAIAGTRHFPPEKLSLLT